MIGGYTKVLCAEGVVISLGGRQAEHLLASGVARRIGEGVLHAPNYTTDEINAITMAEPALRECDFCSTAPAGWRVQCRPFKVKRGPNAGGRLGGPARPVLVCSKCAPYLRANDKRGLLHHAVDGIIDAAREGGLLPAEVAQSWARAAIAPMVAELVNGVFAHRQGPPEEH